MKKLIKKNTEEKVSAGTAKYNTELENQAKIDAKNHLTAKIEQMETNVVVMKDKLTKTYRRAEKLEWDINAFSTSIRMMQEEIEEMRAEREDLDRE